MNATVNINGYSVDPKKLFLRTAIQIGSSRYYIDNTYYSPDGGYIVYCEIRLGEWNRARYMKYKRDEEAYVNQPERLTHPFFGLTPEAHAGRPKDLNSNPCLIKDSSLGKKLKTANNIHLVFELCEYNGPNAVSQDSGLYGIWTNNFRVIATNANIPESFLKRCGFSLLDSKRTASSNINNITTGRWVSFGKRTVTIDHISGGSFYITGKSILHVNQITGGEFQIYGSSKLYCNLIGLKNITAEDECIYKRNPNPYKTIPIVNSDDPSTILIQPCTLNFYGNSTLASNRTHIIVNHFGGFCRLIFHHRSHADQGVILNRGDFYFRDRTTLDHVQTGPKAVTTIIFDGFNSPQVQVGFKALQGEIKTRLLSNSLVRYYPNYPGYIKDKKTLAIIKKELEYMRQVKRRLQDSCFKEAKFILDTNLKKIFEKNGE